MPTHRDTLLTLLAQRAYKYQPEAPFTLASGATSPEYLDCRQALSHPDALTAAGHLLLASLDSRSLAVGGLTMGADPLAVGTSILSERKGKPVRWFSVRKQPKGHGRGRLLEGDVHEGMPVTVFDDVVTSGGSTLEAVSRCKDAGLEVVQVLVLVDREQGGLRAIKEQLSGSIEVSAIVKKSEIKDRWQQLQHG